LSGAGAGAGGVGAGVGAGAGGAGAVTLPSPPPPPPPQAAIRADRDRAVRADRRRIGAFGSGLRDGASERPGLEAVPLWPSRMPVAPRDVTIDTRDGIR